jgi:hypothetical protein
MAGNQPLPGCIELRQRFSHPSTTPAALIILHLRNGGSASVNEALANSIKTILNNAWTSSGLAGHIIPAVVMGLTEIRDMSSNENPWVAATGAGSVGSAVNTTPLPANVSLCVSGQTGKRGPSFRSRTYLWGYSVSAVAAAGGVLQDTADDSAAFMNTIRTGLAGLPQALPLVVVSRFTTPAGGTDPIERIPPIMTDITSYIVKDLRWDSQRRRAVPGI